MTTEEYIVKPVYKALQVLRFLGEERRELALSEIAYHVGLPKTTAFRYLYTLCACGLVTRDPDTDLYRIGLRVWELGQLADELAQVRTIAMPFMRELRDQFNETVNLGVLDGAEVVYLEMSESRRSLRMQAQLGDRDPSYSTALGKSMLAFLPPERWRAHVPPALRQRTPNTITSLNVLYEQLHQIKAQGYAVDDEENEEGARCIGVPLFGHHNHVIAAISLSAPVTRMSERQVAKVASAMIQTASAISQSLMQTPSCPPQK